jgi:Hemerythrin HHE cation binding domain
MRTTVGEALSVLAPPRGGSEPDASPTSDTGNAVMPEPTIELSADQRRKLLRQHRDLRRVLEVTLSATEDTDSQGAKRLPVLVCLALRLQNMLERHATFEEAVLVPHFLAHDPGRVDRLINDHRRQRAELSILAKLAFQNVGLPRVGQAFRCLIRNILTEMDDEERELFRGVRRRSTRSVLLTGGRKRTTTGEFPGDPAIACDEEIGEDLPHLRRRSD